MEAQVCGFDFDANYDYCDADDADDVYHVDADDVGDFDADADDADYNYCGANADDDVVESVPPLWLLSQYWATTLCYLISSAAAAAYPPLFSFCQISVTFIRPLFSFC